MKTRLVLTVAAALISLGSSASAQETSKCCAKKATVDCCERHGRAILGFNGCGNPIHFRKIAHHTCAMHAKVKSSCCPAKDKAKAKDAKHCKASKKAHAACAKPASAKCNKPAAAKCTKPAAAKCAKPSVDCCAK